MKTKDHIHNIIQEASNNKVKRNCDYCNTEYLADPRALKRGWGRTCSKSCAASLREKSKPGYDSKRVEYNNLRRQNWNSNSVVAPNIVGSSGVVTGYTSEGYRIMDGIAYDEFDEPMYEVTEEGEGDEDPADDMYWNDKDY